jgi:hypothetical protein
MPVSRSPTSSQDRATPMSSEATRTLPITSMATFSCGSAAAMTPATISTPNAASSSKISPTWLRTRGRAAGSARMDRRPPSANSRPTTPATAAG